MSRFTIDSDNNITALAGHPAGADDPAAWRERGPSVERADQP